jgi:c-di-GMP-binding flagellar brake protein YcgR
MNGSEAADERRRFPRVLRNVSIQIIDQFNPRTGDYSAGDKGEQSSRDISAGGMRFVSGIPFDVKSRLNLKIKIEGWAMRQKRVGVPMGMTSLAIMAMAEVVWCESSGSGKGYEVGVKFIDIFEEDHKALKEYLSAG